MEILIYVKDVGLKGLDSMDVDKYKSMLGLWYYLSSITFLQQKKICKFYRLTGGIIENNYCCITLC